MLTIAVFVSGKGSNLQALFHACEIGRLHAQIALVISNRDEAPALAWAAEKLIPYFSIQHTPAAELSAFILTALRERNVNFVALAGYLKLIPSEVVQAYRNRIVNVHPALLPDFGGRGMYGHYVHEAVIAAGATVSGATVHLVDEEYDRGPIILQRRTPVYTDDTAETLAARVLEIEHSIFPEALQLFAENRISIEGNRLTIIN
jgi:phosphoribosylglycinamide formyltransferase-1